MQGGAQVRQRLASGASRDQTPPGQLLKCTIVRETLSTTAGGSSGARQIVDLLQGSHQVSPVCTSATRRHTCLEGLDSLGSTTVFEAKSGEFLAHVPGARGVSERLPIERVSLNWLRDNALAGFCQQGRDR